MRVYVALWHREVAGTDVLGVFSTRELAQGAADARVSKDDSYRFSAPGEWEEGVDGTFWIRNLTPGLPDYEGDGLEVEEWTLDATSER